ncbi:hypothetical protein CMK20_03015 [Candidatus Poribacteria bacterium]|nr:hypothetical protein [Candidatus Poribacteria bacterium]
MKHKIRFGIIGIGGTIGGTAKILVNETEAELVALADPDPNRRANILDGTRGVETFDDYKTMLQQVQLDAVCIGLPTWMHASATQDALESGLHVLCEKPPANNAEEMKPLARLASDKNLSCMFVRQSRFTPQLMEGRRLVTSGELGDVYYVDTRWVRTRWCSAKGWRHDKAKGGGVLLDLGIHAIDNAWFMMGCPKPIEVTAGLYNAFSDLAPDGQIYTADDAACGLIRFDNNCVLHFTVAFSLNTADGKTSEDNQPIATEYQRVSLHGTKGGLEDGRQLIGTAQGVEVKPIDTSAYSGDAVTLQTREFIRSIKEEDQPLNSADQAVMLMQMLDGAMESSDTRCAVAIEE